MRVEMTATFGKQTKEVKGLELLTARHLKTKTEVQLLIGKDTPTLDLIEVLEGDIALLGLQGEPMTSLIVTVEGVNHLGYIINRSIGSAAQYGIGLGDDNQPLDWDADMGLFPVVPVGELTIIGSDLPAVMEIVYRLCKRGCSKLSHTQHPLTTYDFKQATGLVTGVTNGDSSALKISEWMELRQLVGKPEPTPKKAKEKPKASGTPEKKATGKGGGKGKSKEKTGFVVKENMPEYIDPPEED